MCVCSNNSGRWLKQPCKEMLDLQLIGNQVPERLHPKSFRSSFEGTTHIWASRDPRFAPYLQVDMQQAVSIIILEFAVVLSLTGSATDW